MIAFTWQMMYTILNISQRIRLYNYELICQTASALSLALFAYNIFLMWLVLKYLITAMLNAALL